MGIIIGLGGLIALIAIMMKSTGQASADEKPYARDLPENVKQTILRESKGLATKTELEAAASAASAAGYEKLSAALYEKSKTAPEVAPFVGVPSPWEGVSNDGWTKFVKLLGKDRVGTVGPRGNVGVFQMTIRRMVDFGLMKNPRKVGPKAVWTADWAIPREKFLSDPALQYKVFVKSMTDYRTLVLDRYREAIGTTFDGKTATLSGLLAVAHLTGADGLGKWLKNEPPRTKFKATMEAYEKANSLF